MAKRKAKVAASGHTEAQLAAMKATYDRRIEEFKNEDGAVSEEKVAGALGPDFLQFI